jgi:hypothetical protein
VTASFTEDGSSASVGRAATVTIATGAGVTGAVTAIIFRLGHPGSSVVSSRW